MAKAPKKLADILKTKNPFMRSKTDAKFASSHTVTKLKNDQATEKDSQFVSDTPFFDRHIAHGYNPGEDEAAYDSYVNEANSKQTALIKRDYYVDKLSKRVNSSSNDAWKEGDRPDDSGTLNSFSHKTKRLVQAVRKAEKVSGKEVSRQRTYAPGEGLSNYTIDALHNSRPTKLGEEKGNK